MTKASYSPRQIQLWSAVIAAIMFLFISTPQAAAQCQVGTQVQGDMGGGKVGKIAEIGNEPPYVGWYRIVFDWNAPRGDWYDPKAWQIYVAGTKTRCGQNAPAERPQSQETTGEARAPERNPEAEAPAQGDCSMNQPAGKVTKTAPASAQLFKRVIYELEAAKINPTSVSAPKKIGLTFLKFEMGAPYRNTLTSSRFGDKRRHDGAPVGAMIYPIKTRELQCELYDTSVKRWVTENEGNCFKNDLGEWTCPRRTIKFVENKRIPLE